MTHKLQRKKGRIIDGEKNARLKSRIFLSVVQENIFISYISYQLHCCALPDKHCLSHGMLPLSGHDDVALIE